MNTQSNRFNSRPEKPENEGEALPYELQQHELNAIFTRRQSATEKVRWPMFRKSKVTALPHVREDQLATRVKEALQGDYDPNESLAALRAILVGPSRRLHEARLEEIITILEEADRASEAAIHAVEKRCISLNDELKESIEIQDGKLNELFHAIDSKFKHLKAEIDAQFAESADATELSMVAQSSNFSAQLKEQDERLTRNLDTLTQQFEDRFLGQDDTAEKLGEHSTPERRGFGDIARRLSALRKNLIG